MSDADTASDRKYRSMDEFRAVFFPEEEEEDASDGDLDKEARTEPTGSELATRLLEQVKGDLRR